MPRHETRNMTEMDLPLDKCPYCRRHMNKHTATSDHIIPTSAKGSNDYRNKSWACGTCNNVVKTGTVYGVKRLAKKVVPDAVGKIFIPDPKVRRD
jgi:5-methylcytosine-specific restriction endonuclease McrA